MVLQDGAFARWPVSADEEHHFTVEKLTAVVVSESDLDWLILRPSMLHDRAGTGWAAPGSVQLHGEIAREDIAATLAELLDEARIARHILELDEEQMPIAAAVRAQVR